MADQGTHNLLYRFLFDPALRIARHIVLLITLGVIATDSIILIYSGTDVPTSAIIACYMVVYLLFIYINIYLLIPRLLLKNRYKQYLISLSVIILIIVTGDICTEYSIHQYYNIAYSPYSFFSSASVPAIEFIAALVITSLYMGSISLTVFFKNWMQSNEKVEMLKKQQLHSELNAFKNSISPVFLLNTLHTAKRVTQTNPQEASQILLQLSHILRYQLYDCKMDRVLLHAEVSFINNYLTLEKKCDEKLTFSLVHPPLNKPYLIPPLLLISFIEDALEHLRNRIGNKQIDIKFSITDNKLTFCCTDNREEFKDSHRLELLRKQGYMLTSGQTEIPNQYNVTFRYTM